MGNEEDDRKVVFVTGCAKGGIGFEYCKAFAEQNCMVYASDVPQRMSDLEGFESSENVEAIELDVLSDESVRSAVKKVVSEHGKIDVLVNNAGIGSSGPLAELPLEDVRKAWEINAVGQLRLVQNVVPFMAERGCGTIVNVGSVVGRVSTPWAGSYCSSKAYVHAMSDTLRVELKPFGIDVVLVIPGSVRSNFGSATTERLGSRDWKLYKEFKEAIADRAMASQGSKATDPAMFARHVVKKVLSPRPPRQIMFGRMTGLVAALSWSPLWVRDAFFRNRFGLNKKL
uniref:Uncharacterized protein n=1 Tax=Kalanchoe fedtschenkoi TaxID=63787 RepID=A0A7N0VIC1_KALFE